MDGMRTTTVDGSVRGRRPFGPTTNMLLDVFCLILNAGNPAGRPQLAEVETSSARH